MLLSHPCSTTDGQLTDLLALFREHGFPSNRCGGDVELASYVFNGDFVDRGAQQVEVVGRQITQETSAATHTLQEHLRMQVIHTINTPLLKVRHN